MPESQSGTLFLIPVPVAENGALHTLSPEVIETAQSLEYFIAEDASTARRHLKAMGFKDLSRAQIMLLNEHSDSTVLKEPLGLLKSGVDIGLMSDAGCPGIADPGAEMVRKAHQHGIKVRPRTGPSSIVLAIMSSGFNGQNFAFLGYLPVEKHERHKRIREVEQSAIRNKQAQFFIETPYRNRQMFESLLSTLNSGTMLYVGINLSSREEFIKSQTVSEWKKTAVPEMHKVPAVFGIFV